jgi:hypothetical protein
VTNILGEIDVDGRKKMEVYLKRIWYGVLEYLLPTQDCGR